MTKREKVMRGLKICSTGTFDDCLRCPYDNQKECQEKMCADALDLLKESPVSEIWTDENGFHWIITGFRENEPPQKYVPSIGGARDFGTISSHWYKCGFPECGFPIDRGDIYCRHCGRLIAWEEPGKPEPPKEEA